MIATIINEAKRDWFVPAFVVALTAAVCLSRVGDQPVGWDIALLVDFGVFMPNLYYVCYRHRLSPSAISVRIVALMCSAIFLAAWLTIDRNEQLVHQLTYVRWIGLTLVIAFEVFVLVAVFRIVFRKDVEATQLEALGVPRLVARLMLLEARFWRWLLRPFRRD